MSPNKNPILAEHFERLKELLPEVYTKPERLSKADKLYKLLKNSLGVIEAVYLQNPEMFHSARVEAYADIIQEVKKLGYTYQANPEIMDKAASQLIIQAKKPMQKVGREKDQGSRKAI